MSWHRRSRSSLPKKLGSASKMPPSLPRCHPICMNRQRAAQWRASYRAVVPACGALSTGSWGSGAARLRTRCKGSSQGACLASHEGQHPAAAAAHPPAHTGCGPSRPLARPSRRCCPAQSGARCGRCRWRLLPRLPLPPRCHRWPLPRLALSPRLQRSVDSSHGDAHSTHPLLGTAAASSRQGHRMHAAMPLQAAGMQPFLPASAAHHPWLLVIGEGVRLARSQEAAAQVAHHHIHGGSLRRTRVHPARRSSTRRRRESGSGGKVGRPVRGGASI